MEKLDSIQIENRRVKMSVLYFIARWFWVLGLGMFVLYAYVIWTYVATRIFWDKELKKDGFVWDNDELIKKVDAEDCFACWAIIHAFGLCALSFVYWFVTR